MTKEMMLLGRLLAETECCATTGGPPCDCPEVPPCQAITFHVLGPLAITFDRDLDLVDPQMLELPPAP